MNDLTELVGILNKEEARSLKIYLNRTNATGERKDEHLFDAIRKQYPEYNEAEIFEALYGEAGNKNALYRLKNRLQNEINKSLTIQYYDQSDYSNILHHILLARIFLRKNAYKVSFRYLKKAERKALKSENLHLLDLIYNHQIRLSHETLLVDPAEYIEKRKQNRRQLRQLQEMDDILAMLIYRIKSSQNFGEKDDEVSKVLTQIVEQLGESDQVFNSPQLKFRVYQAVSRLLLQQNNFQALENYLRETYPEFINIGFFTRDNHETKLQMLTYLVNACFKNNRIKDSLQYAEELHKAMKEHNKLLYDKYLFFYYNSLVINYSEIDKRKAIRILEEARDHKTIQKLPVYNVFVNLNLGVLHFDTQDFKMALKNVVNLKMEESFAGLDEGFRMKINIMELMIRYELKDYDFLDYQIDQVTKEHNKLLNGKSFKRDKEFCAIITSLIDLNADTKDKAKKRIEKFVSTYQGQAQESDILNYENWLTQILEESFR